MINLLKRVAIHGAEFALAVVVVTVTLETLIYWDIRKAQPHRDKIDALEAENERLAWELNRAL